MQVGFGYDVHRLAIGETFILGGVTIDSEFGTIAHSDGDVVAHAVIDALLGAAGMGDIGEHFPDTDATYKNANSMELLRRTMMLIIDAGFKVVNIDIAINLEKPKLKNYKDLIRKNIALASQIDTTSVNIKATTNENMGFVGRGEGIAVFCVCLIDKFL